MRLPIISLPEGLRLLLVPTSILGNAVITLMADAGADEEGHLEGVKIVLLACFFLAQQV